LAQQLTSLQVIISAPYTGAVVEAIVHLSWQVQQELAIVACTTSMHFSRHSMDRLQFKQSKAAYQVYDG
jgi:hypothetical protein